MCCVCVSTPKVYWEGFNGSSSDVSLLPCPRACSAKAKLPGAGSSTTTASPWRIFSGARGADECDACCCKVASSTHSGALVQRRRLPTIVIWLARSTPSVNAPYSLPHNRTTWLFDHRCANQTSVPVHDSLTTATVPCRTANPSTGSIEAPWLCQFASYGCTDPTADNYRSWYTISWPSMCQFAGCNDTDASNYDSVVRNMRPPAKRLGSATPPLHKHP